MSKTIHQKVTFRASQGALFDTYLSSRKHSAATDAKAVMSRHVGGTFSAHAGHLRGRNLAIVPNRLIVQSWRGSNWKKGDLDSTLVLVFSRVPGGGRISMPHVNAPQRTQRNLCLRPAPGRGGGLADHAPVRHARHDAPDQPR